MAGKSKKTDKKKAPPTATKKIDETSLRGVAGGKAKTADKAFQAMDNYIRG